MAVTPKRLMAPTQLPIASAAQYTATGIKSAIIKKCSLCNTTGTNRTVTLFVVPSGRAADASTTLLDSTTIVAAHTTVEVYDLEGHVLLVNDALWAVSDAASSVTMHLSGVEVS